MTASDGRELPSRIRPAAAVLTALDRADCFVNTTAVLLADRRLDVRLLGDGWGYRYDPAPPGGGPGALLPSSTPREDVLRHWYGLEEVAEAGPDRDAAWSRLCAALDAGRAVGAVVDTFAFRISAYHRTEHYAHRFVLHRRNGAVVEVLDGLGPRRWQGRLTRDELFEAMDPPDCVAGPGGPVPRNCTVRLAPVAGPAPGSAPGSAPDSAPGSAPGIGPDRLRSALRTAVEVGSAAGGLPRFLDDLRATAAATAPAAAAGRELWLPGVGAFGAVAQQRALNALFLELAADRLGVDLHRAVDTFRRSGETWTTTGRELHAAALAGRDLPPVAERVALRLAAAAEQETAALQDVDAALAGRG